MVGRWGRPPVSGPAIFVKKRYINELTYSMLTHPVPKPSRGCRKSVPALEQSGWEISVPSSRALPAIGSFHRLPPGRVFPRSGCRTCCRRGWRTRTSLPGMYGQGRPQADISSARAMLSSVPAGTATPPRWSTNASGRRRSYLSPFSFSERSQLSSFQSFWRGPSTSLPPSATSTAWRGGQTCVWY